MEDLGRFGGVGTEKTDEVEAVGREGVVEVKGHLLTGEPACYPTVHTPRDPGAPHGPLEARQYQGVVEGRTRAR